MVRGVLRIYLGAAPGVGKTVAMLAEGNRRAARGTDVVVGLVETHDRAFTASQVAGLEVLPRRVVEYRGATLTELDVDAVLARRPDVALVDELAHTNAPGSRNHKRWADIEELLAAGIDVVSTVNIQHLESLNDVVESITGVSQQETVPDDVIRAADQVELVDMSPEALRRRMAHGNVYPAGRIDAALANYFRAGNLTALRELALLWMADRVDEALERYRSEHGISSPWPTRERIVVALASHRGSDAVLRRAALIAARGAGSELHACHVVRPDGLVDGSAGNLDGLRQLVRELGGTWHSVTGDEVAAAVLDFARGVNATQIVVGTSGPKDAVRALLSRGTADRIAAESGEIDVHLVSVEGSAGRTRAARASDLSRGRRLAGWLLATLGVGALTAVLVVGLGHGGEAHDLPVDVLLYLGLTVAVAIVGGIWPGLAAAVLASATLNWFFTPPVGELTVTDPRNALALAVFIAVAASVASLVHVAARRSERARHAEAQARTMASLADSLLAVTSSSTDPLGAFLDQARATFEMTGAAVVARPSVHQPWEVLAASGTFHVEDVASAAVRAPVEWTRAGQGRRAELVLLGRSLPAHDQVLVSAFTSHASALLTRRDLESEASRVKDLARDNRARTALLAAVSHDLRTPLASIKAAVSSLRQTDIRFEPADEAALLESVEESADRLAVLIGNLLDMSRLQTGTLIAHPDEVWLAAAVQAAAHTVTQPERVRTRLDEGAALVVADAGLLDRVLANILENAVRHSPGRREVVVTSGRLQSRVQMRVVDRGPGVSDAAKEDIFLPFQRGGDAPRGEGVGLGLAVARGLTELMGGHVWAEDTPGGGLTVVVELPAATVSTSADSAAAGGPAASAQRPSAAVPEALR